MPYGDPPRGPWCDAIGYLPWAQLAERLGPPFESVLFDNLWELYARDRQALWFWDVP